MDTPILLSEEGRVGIITLNRPKALNALNSALMNALIDALRSFDANPDIGAVIIRGSERAFAAGADITEMANKTAPELYASDIFGRWDEITQIRIPVIAEVSGYALGGGCELAMMADLIVASETAVFGQPEVGLGIMPGIGGTQRLVRAVGKSLAMDMILSGRRIGADEALQAGLVARVYPQETVAEETLKLAKTIANFSRVATTRAKEAVNTAFETTLSQGVAWERRGFQAMFASYDQKEGMSAFVEKRAPNFEHR